MARAPQPTCTYCDTKIAAEAPFCSSCAYPTPWATTEDRTAWEVRQWQRYSEKNGGSRSPQAPVLVSVRTEPVAAPPPVAEPAPEHVPAETRPVPVTNGRSAVKPVPKPARPIESEDVHEPAPEPVRQAAPEPVRQAAPEPVRQAAPEPVRQAAPEPVHQAAPEPAVALSELTGAVGKLRALFQRLQDDAGAPQLPSEDHPVVPKTVEATTTEPVLAPWLVPQPAVRPVAPAPRPVTPKFPRVAEPQRPKASQKQASQRSRNGAKAQPAPKTPKRRRDPNEKLLRDTVLVLRQLSATMNEMAGALRAAQETQRRSIFRRHH
jgi:hypothetical protein